MHAAFYTDVLSLCSLAVLRRNDLVLGTNFLPRKKKVSAFFEKVASRVNLTRLKGSCQTEECGQ